MEGTFVLKRINTHYFYTHETCQLKENTPLTSVMIILCFMNRLEYTRQDIPEKQETLVDGPLPELQVKLLHQIHQTT